MSNGTLAIRVRPDSPNHHLWNNNGTWWCHYTIHLPDFTKKRVRVSLDAFNPREARAKRDVLLTGNLCTGRN
jgi:hypothetical protein